MNIGGYTRSNTFCGNLHRLKGALGTVESWETPEFPSDIIDYETREICKDGHRKMGDEDNHSTGRNLLIS